MKGLSAFFTLQNGYNQNHTQKEKKVPAHNQRQDFFFFRGNIFPTIGENLPILNTENPGNSFGEMGLRHTQ